MEMQSKHELARARRSLESLVKEKQQLSRQLKDSKHYIHKLETTLTLGKTPKGVAYTNQVALLAQENQELAATNASLQDQIKHLEAHAVVLSKALEIRADHDGLDPQYTSKLLYDLGQSRQQVYVLQEGNLDYQDVIHDLKQRLEETQQANRSILSQKERVAEQLTELQVTNKNNEKSHNQLRKVMHTQELTLAKEENQQLLEQVGTLEQKLQARNKLMYQVSKFGIKNEIQLAKYVEHTTTTREKAEALQLTQTESLNKLQSKDADQAKRISKLRKEVQDLLKENQELLTAEFGRRRQLEITQEQASQLTSLLKEKEQEIEALTTTSNALALKVQKLNSAISKYQQTASEQESKGLQTETLFKSQLDNALADLENLSNERDQLQEAMQEAVLKCTESMNAHSEALEENQRLQELIEQLTASRGLLQQTYTKEKTEARHHISALEAELSELTRENKRLQSRYSLRK